MRIIHDLLWGNFNQDTLYGISLNCKYFITKLFETSLKYYDTSLENFWDK